MARPVLLDTTAGALVTPATGAAGDVLTSDASGNATWQTPSGTQATTKRVYYNPGGQWPDNMGSTASISSCGLRFVIKLPVTTTRWRFVARNYDVAYIAAQQPLTGAGVAIGVHARTATGARTGNFEGATATSLLGGGYTIPGDGSWYQSEWFTDPAAQFQAGQEHLLATGYTRSPTGAVINAVGECWRWTSSASALDPTITSGSVATTGTPLDWGIEYECLTSRGHFFLVGDSIAEGITGVQGTSTASWRHIPLSQTWPRNWAYSHGTLVSMLAINGFSAANYASAAFQPLWDRFDGPAMNLDGVILAVGSNDAFGNRTLAQFQADIATIIGKAFTLAGGPVPLYAVTVIPRGGFSAGQNTLRRSYNTWLYELPFGLAGVVDADLPFRTSNANFDVPVPTHVTDNIHPSFAGLALFEQLAGAVIRPIS